MQNPEKKKNSVWQKKRLTVRQQLQPLLRQSRAAHLHQAAVLLVVPAVLLAVVVQVHPAHLAVAAARVNTLMMLRQVQTDRQLPTMHASSLAIRIATNGADCSGFVMSVYAAFGVSLPHSSSALRSVGYGVSIDEIQPGDIVCYSGHVGIYAGNNTLVHASSPETGIKYTSPITYRTVLAVRRIF